MAVHVATLFAGMVGVADEAISPDALVLQQPVDSFADGVLVAALAHVAAFHEQGDTGQPGHGDGVLVAIGAPVSVLLLLLGDPVEAAANGFAVLLGDLVPAHRLHETTRQHQAARQRTEDKCPLHKTRLLKWVANSPFAN